MTLSRRALLLALTTTTACLARAAEANASVVLPLAEAPDALIPGLSAAVATRVVGGQIYRGLVRFGAGGAAPDLATAWEVAPGGLDYLFHLRQGVTWHDGSALTAEDVVFSLDRFHRTLQPLLGLERVTRVSVEGDAVRLALAKPYPALLRLLDATSAPVVPRHVHDRPGFATDPRAVPPVGAGPFRVAEWLRLERFAGYVGPATALQEITCPVLPDPAARLERLAAGHGLMVADPALWAILPRLRQDGSLAVAAAVPPTAAPLAGLRVNLARAPLADPRVRRALAAAVNRAALVQAVWQGVGRPAAGPVLRGSEGRDAAATLPDYDPRAASALLDAAGARPGDDGVRLRLTHLVAPGEPWAALAEALQGALGLVGVELSPRRVSVAEWNQLLAAGDYDTATFRTPQLGEVLYDLQAYAAEVPEITPLLAAGNSGAAQRQLVSAMPRLWLAEPEDRVAQDSRLVLPSGAYGSFAGAFFG